MSDSTVLANVVSAYVIILSGLLALAFTWLMGRQPKRWMFSYFCIVITGIATVWYHGFGETFLTVLVDISTNVLVAWALQVAVLGDFYSRPTQWRVSMVLGMIDLMYFLWMIVVGPLSTDQFPLSLGTFGGFSYGELLVFFNSLLLVGLLYSRISRIPLTARPLLYLLSGIFFIAMLFATATNQRVDFHLLPYHATWHILSAFGFIALWAFNHSRFHLQNPETSRS